MSSTLGWLLVAIVWPGLLIQNSWQHTSNSSIRSHLVSQPDGVDPAKSHFDKSLRFNVYRFNVTAADSGRVRDLLIKAYRGELLLTNFRVRVDGAVVGAEVADLDGNRFPELYVYTASYGSGSFGRVYAWQFLPDRKADVALPNWRAESTKGYMGHDSLWVDEGILCRKYPVYRFGDANAEPSGGYQMIRYKLRPAGAGYSLVAE